MFENRSATSYKSIAYIQFMVKYDDLKSDPSFGHTCIWKPFTKKCFVASLVAYGPVVPIDYRQSDLETGQNLIRKAQEEKLLTALQGSII